MNIISLCELQKTIEERIRNKIQKLYNKKITLATILTSTDISSKKYIFHKTKKGIELGINIINFTITDISEIKHTIEELNHNNEIHGILVQLPLNDEIRSEKNVILNLIDPKKDCDCLTSHNLSRLFNNDFELLPATVKAIIEILKFILGKHSFNKEIKRKKICIINNSNLIGLPLCIYFSKQDSTITLCNEYTENIRQITLESDIVISATGKGQLFDALFFKDNSIVIDVTSLSINKKVIGDIIYNTENNKNIIVTPVPGGVGPLTVLCLFENLISIYEKYHSR